MRKRPYFFLLALCSATVLFSSAGHAQYPIMDRIANKVIQKYQNSTCQQLWQKKGQPPSQREQEAIQIMRNNPDLRAAFINQVAGPIANKMFECGMIP